MSSQDKKHRSHLPMPNTGKKGLITFDAKDPASKFPPIERLRPPKGAPNVLIVLIDDVGFGATSAFGGPCQTPTAEKLAAGGLKFTRFHTTALCSPTRQALLTGRNHHSVGMGGITEIATGAPGYCSVLPNSDVAAREDAETQRLLHRAIRQVPRSAGLGDEPGRSVRRLADRRRRLRVLLRIHRRRGQPVVPDALRRHDAGRAGEDAGGGLPPDRGHDRQGDCLDRPAEKSRARQAVLHLLRARRDARAAPCAEGVGRQVQGQVRSGLGQAARRDLCPAEEAGRHPAGLRAHGAAQGDPGLGRDAGGVQAGAAPRDGGVRGLPRVHRSPCGPAVRLADQAGHRRRHAHLLHRRRQRRLRRRVAQRLLTTR